jgi:type IV pilus assembly protein PilA
MLARIRKSMEDKDQGFTLIELLVVIIIIGILAAIAIPVFLNQRKKAVDASIKSDLRTVATEMETYFTDAQTYPAVSASSGSTSGGNTIVVGTDTVQLSSGNTVSVVVSTNATANNVGTAYAVCGWNPKGTGTTAAASYIYISDQGGLQQTKGACPAAGSVL